MAPAWTQQEQLNWEHATVGPDGLARLDAIVGTVYTGSQSEMAQADTALPPYRALAEAWVLLAQATVAADVVAVQPLPIARKGHEVRRVELEPFTFHLDLVFRRGPAGARFCRVAVRRHALGFFCIAAAAGVVSAAVWCAASHCSQRVVLSQAPLKLAAMASRACSPVVLQFCVYAALDTASDAVYDAAH